MQWGIVPQFYLRAAAETKPRIRLAAVCYHRIESGGSPGHFRVLLADEWGEKEILRKLKDMGLFELDQLFVPIGPDLEADLSFIVSRAVQFGMLKLGEEPAADFVRSKISQSSTQNTTGASVAVKHESKSPGRETNRQMVERLCREGESFLRRHAAQPT